MENNTREQVGILRQALERAKQMLAEQKQVIDDLMSPPLLYATAVALSEWTPPPLREEYEVINGEVVSTDPRLESLDGVKKGDILGVTRTGRSEVRKELLDAKKLKVVGFTTDLIVVIQIEDGPVATCSHRYFSSFFEVKGQESESRPTCIIALDGKFVEVFVPKDLRVTPGDTVVLAQQTQQIVDVAGIEPSGSIAIVRKAIDDTFAEVEHESALKVIFSGKFSENLEKGDRVVLDNSGSIIVKNLGKDDEKFKFSAETNISWDDIGGLEEAKEQMIEAVELPHSNPDIFRFYGKKPVKGILLYGPPGCGKTMIGKATATALSRIYNGTGVSNGFIYVKGPEILDRWVGSAEATVRGIFDRARKHKETHGYPAVVFIDEADAILAKRGTGISSDIERTIVPMFLTEMDGLEDSGALVLLATNRSDILDPAVVRDGRVDRKIKIGRPSKESAAQIFKLSLKKVPTRNGFTTEELARYGSDEVFDEKRVLYTIKTGTNGSHKFTLGHVVNGGMIVSIVDQATSIALHRDLANKKREGLARDDIKDAIDSVEKQNRDLNHKDELSDFVHDFRDDVVQITRLRQATA